MIFVQNVTKIFEFDPSHSSIKSFLVSKREQFTAVDRVSMDIKQGEIYGLLGSNGAGKTTLIKMICGLLKPTNGEIYVEGKPVFQAQRDIGLVLGDSLLYNVMTGRDNLAYTARLYGVRSINNRIQELIYLLNIDPKWLDRYVSEYSLGMRVKLCFARALVYDPSVLLLDEPTLGLDPHIAIQVRNIIKRLNKTIILTTHYLEEIESLTHRIGILHRGRLVAEGSAEELKQKILKAGDTSLTDVFLALTTS